MTGILLAFVLLNAPLAAFAQNDVGDAGCEHAALKAQFTEVHSTEELSALAIKASDCYHWHVNVDKNRSSPSQFCELAQEMVHSPYANAKVLDVIQGHIFYVNEHLSQRLIEWHTPEIEPYLRQAIKDFYLTDGFDVIESILDSPVIEDNYHVYKTKIAMNLEDMFHYGLFQTATEEKKAVSLLYKLFNEPGIMGSDMTSQHIIRAFYFMAQNEKHFNATYDFLLTSPLLGPEALGHLAYSFGSKDPSPSRRFFKILSLKKANESTVKSIGIAIQDSTAPIPDADLIFRKILKLDDSLSAKGIAYRRLTLLSSVVWGFRNPRQVTHADEIMDEVLKRYPKAEKVGEDPNWTKCDFPIVTANTLADTGARINRPKIFAQLLNSAAVDCKDGIQSYIKKARDNKKISKAEYDELTKDLHP